MREISMIPNDPPQVQLIADEFRRRYVIIHNRDGKEPESYLIPIVMLGVNFEEKIKTIDSSLEENYCYGK